MHQDISQYEDSTSLAVRSMVVSARNRAQREQDVIRELLEALERVAIGFRVLREVGYSLFVTADGEAIDDRACSDFESADTEWGEQDDLSNVPRKATH